MKHYYALKKKFEEQFEMYIHNLTPDMQVKNIIFDATNDGKRIRPVIIMEMIGKNHNDRFYPTFSGVAQSHNYYPVSHMKRNQGIGFIALGLSLIHI